MRARIEPARYTHALSPHCPQHPGGCALPSMEGSVRPHLLPRALGQRVRGSGGGSLGATLWPRLWLSRFCLTNWLLHPFLGPCGGLSSPRVPVRHHQTTEFLGPQQGSRANKWLKPVRAAWSSCGSWGGWAAGLGTWGSGTQRPPAPGLRLFIGALGPGELR